MRRLAIVAAYAVVFWLLLPWLLMSLGASVDRHAGWARASSAWGLPLLLTGTGLLAAGMRELWQGGGGLPIGALPPPRFTRRGPYRLVRHPIYFGFNLALAGAGLLVGSPGLAFVVAPLFLPLWMAYAKAEERVLVRRFGSDYRRYRRRVGMLPRLGLYRVSQAAMWLGVLPWQCQGRRNVPRRGPVVLVFNHATFFDPAYLGACLLRPIHFLTTAEAYRPARLRWVVSRFVNIPLRRYRQDVVACREMLRVLADGGVIGMAVEGERSPWGRYQGTLPDVARIVARLGVPVVPVGINGSYDAGPRWADRSRRRPVNVRFGPPLAFSGRDPVAVVDDGIAALVAPDPQPVDLRGLDRTRLARVLWRCPSCGAEAPWDPVTLGCSACAWRIEPMPDGRFLTPDGRQVCLADLGDRVLSWEEHGPIHFQASVWHEDSWYGPIRPLRCLGDGQVTIGPDGIASGFLALPLQDLSTVSTERADRLQISTRSSMWQVRPHRVSVFRLEAAIRRWRGREPVATGVSSKYS